MVSPVTDPDLIKRLEANSSNQPITDPDMIAKLESSSTGTSQKPTTGNLYDIARDALAGVLTGLGRGGEFIAKTATGGYAPDLPQDLINKVGSSNPSVVGKIAKGVGEYAPYAIAGGAGLLPEISTEGTSAYKVGNLLKNLAANPGQIASGALSGAATNPDDRVQGALESAIMNALTGGAANALEAIRPSNVLRGTLTPEQLQKNVDVTAGTQTPLGSVIDSPALKRLYENVLSVTPFSGSNSVSQEVASQIKQKGQDLLGSIGADLDQNSGIQLQSALKKAASDAKAEKDKNFIQVNKLADDAGLTVGRSNFSNYAKQALQEIGESPELKREFPSDLMSDLQYYASNPEGNTLKLSNIFKGKLGDKANDLYTNGKTYEYGIVKGLKDALQSDIDSSIEGSGSKALREQYDKAQTDYQQKFAPFEDPDIVKFTRRGGDPDLMLSNFLKTGANDRSILLAKLQSKLPSDTKMLPLKMYLSKAVDDEGNVNPLAFRSLYNKLGENQKNVLIKDNDLKKNLDDYVDLVGKNTAPLSIMANPNTGQRNLDAITAATLGSLGHAVGGNIGALAGTVGAIGSGRLATKALTSEAVRNALVKSMIKNKPLFTGGAKIPSYQTAQQALIKALGGDNSQ
jgi:hypothetical protein